MLMNRAEFETSLIHPLEFWREKSPVEVRMLLGDLPARMVGFNQKNPHHCYDLFSHTLHTVENIPISSDMLLRVSAFFHDIGKPDVGREKDGRFVFYGHAKKSAEIAPIVLGQLGYHSSEREMICFYILHHDDFISWVLPKELNASGQKAITLPNIQKYLNKITKENSFLEPSSVLTVCQNLLCLCSADISAQSDKIFREGILIDTKVQKLKRINLINQYILESVRNGKA